MAAAAAENPWGMDMTIELKMPALSPTMEKGTLAKWLVAMGDIVKAGDPIAEIETDKATMELEAADDGRIETLVIAEGTDDVAVGTVIARLSDAAAAAVPAAIAPTADAAAVSASPTIVPAQRPRHDAISATPLARRLAEAKAIPLGGIAGSGARGRIVKADLALPSVVAARQPAPRANVAAPAILREPPAGVPVTRTRLSGMRKAIARRLGESKQTVPHFYLTARCRIDALLKLRTELNAGLQARGVKLSVNDLLIKTMALAMTEVPETNVQFGGDELYSFGRVDIAMAVAIEGGLVTPVIRGVDGLSLSAIARASASLAARAREGRLLPEDYRGGTASISNLGMYGIDEMIPVINPPQALILGIGAGIELPWKVDGAIALATILAATASFDHRAIDGAAAARFMAAFRALVEEPLRICS